jgi:hypothetical protein
MLVCSFPLAWAKALSPRCQLTLMFPLGVGSGLSVMGPPGGRDPRNDMVEGVFQRARQ